MSNIFIRKGSTAVAFAAIALSEATIGNTDEIVSNEPHNPAAQAETIESDNPVKTKKNIVSSHSAAEIDRLCREYEKIWFSGSVLIVQDGQIVLQGGYGLADKENNRANTPYTVYEIASLSKQFTAAAILLLEQNGKLSTDDPISKYIPDLPEGYEEVKIYHLLTHTGGLPGGGNGRGSDFQAAVKAHLTVPPTSEPGEKFSYSNVDYSLLAGIVEIVSKQSLEKFCHQNLFQPANMNSTGFCGEVFNNNDLALGYSFGKNLTPRPPSQDPYTPIDEFGYEYKGMGGVLTNTFDIYKWHRALEEELILNKKYKEKLFTPFMNDYACGWEVFNFPDGRKCIGHGGKVQGFICKDWYFPEDDCQIIILTNSDYFKYTMLNEIYSILFSDEN